MLKAKYLLLLILPVTFIVNVFYNNKTEFEQDPNYMYMFNALNLTTHPGSIATYTQGTTTVEISAIIMRVHHLFRKSDDSFTDDVLKNPQLYIKVVVRTFVVLISILLLISGIFITRMSGEVQYGIILQAYPVFSKTVMPWALESFAAEPLILIAVTCFVLLTLWRFFFARSFGDVVIFRNKNREISIEKFTIFSGLIMGFCLATKINTFPLILLPLIMLQRQSDKIALMASCFLSYIFFTLPVANLYKLTIYWYFQVFIHSGIYGEGSPTIVDFGSFLVNFRILLRSEIIIVSVITISLIYLVIQGFRKKFDQGFKLLMIFLTVQIITILAVLKHFYLYYLIPVIPTIAVNIFLVLKSLRMSATIRALLITAFISLCFSLNSDFNIRVPHFYSSVEPSDGINVYSYMSDSPIYALKLGDDASRNANSKRLKDLYGDHYFYDIWNKIIITWTDTIDISDLLSRKVYLHAYDQYMKDLPPPFDIEPVSEGLFLVSKPDTIDLAETAN